MSADPNTDPELILRHVPETDVPPPSYVELLSLVLAPTNAEKVAVETPVIPAFNDSLYLSDEPAIVLPTAISEFDAFIKTAYVPIASKLVGTPLAVI